jgi:glycine/D-amino acid oxidase-like deaminating enzyme
MDGRHQIESAQRPHPPDPVPVAFRLDPAADLPPAAEVIVIGAGMVGASAAYQLARAGMRPLVIEANSPASGASGRLAGLTLAGLGAHFGRVTRLVQESGGRSILDYTLSSLRLLDDYQADLPGGFDWERCGSLDLLTSEEQELEGRLAATAQADEGQEVAVVGPTELADLAPALDVSQVRAAKWTPGDGQLNPFKLVYGLLEAAHRLGGKVVTGVRAERLLARGGRVTGVETSHGQVQSGAVLVAANAWTAALVPTVGANLMPLREHVLVTEPLPRVLFQSFETNRCSEYWRQEPSGEVLIGGFAAADEGMGIGSYSMVVRPAIPPLLAGVLGRFHPQLKDARVVRAWAGLLDFASLEIPMAGPIPTDDGLPLPGGFVVCGLTGHGTPYAPILGLLMAELISSGATTTLPLAPFDPKRYAGTAHPPTWMDAFHAPLPVTSPSGG